MSSLTPRRVLYSFLIGTLLSVCAGVLFNSIGTGAACFGLFMVGYHYGGVDWQHSFFDFLDGG